MQKKKWTDEDVVNAILEISNKSGVMPTAHSMRVQGRNDLACQVSRRGGFIEWARRLGLSTVQSDSATGWDGEIALNELLIKKGFVATRSEAVKAPHDILVDGILRLDVKSARYAEYGVCKGWFYRIGKTPQADIIALYQIDTNSVYFVPWSICPTTNITISRDGGKYKRLKNRFDLLRVLSTNRQKETLIWTEQNSNGKDSRSKKS